MKEGRRQAAGLSIYYREDGEGTPIILLHCAGGTCGQWRKLMERMSDRHRLIAMDMVSHGKSDKPPSDIENVYDLEVNILSSFVDMTAQPVHLVGHSLGGATAARFALRSPERVRSLTLFEPVLFQLLANGGHDPGWEDLQRLTNGIHERLAVGDKRGAAEALVDYWARPGTFQAMSEEHQAHAIRRMDVSAITVQKYIDDPTFGLINPSDIPAPTMLLSSENSPLSARSVVDLLSERMPNARMHRFKNGGHMAPLTNADQVNAIIEQHITAYAASSLLAPSKHHSCAA